MESLAYADLPDRMPFRPSRTNYPGSRFGPKTRYDLPQRHKSYGNGDTADSILYSGTNLQPHVWQPGQDPNLGSMATSSPLFAQIRTPREDSGAVLSDAARSMLHPLAERNLPLLPLLDERNDVHGILVVGGTGCGKTSVILSMLAHSNGSFPSRKDPQIMEKKRTMPAYGQQYELPEREVQMGGASGTGGGETKLMRLVLTDTPACGTNLREEQPLCATVSPNSTQHFNAIPSWMRITLRGGNFPHYAVLFIIDGLATPLWEDSSRCRDLARLLAVLRRNQYTVVLGVTKLLKLRQIALREAAHGTKHEGQVGKDPRSSYEVFVGRYLDKVCASLQAKALENDWSFDHEGPDKPSFPLVNSTIFDVPTWTSAGDYKAWQDKKGTSELPNLKYLHSQLSRMLASLARRSHPDS
mmetsp:Transcript_26986/g.46839  ORF Transcript_26986/g.46839 Transcript_26986/m.46839 type:complete len:413 (-) Transcript_26986:70-1308(-)